MGNLNDEEIKERLVFLLEKAELSSEEMSWLLSYLERENGQEFREILYKRFQQGLAASDIILEPEQKNILNNIREKLYKRLFG